MIGFHVHASNVIYYDNHGSILVANNPIAHSKKKYVELHVHYLRQMVQENVVSLLYCKTHNQVANIFMKPLPKYKFMKLQAMLRALGSYNYGGVQSK